MLLICMAVQCLKMLIHDEIEIRYGHPHLYMNKLEEFSYTPDNSDIGYILEVDLRYPDNTKKKTKQFPYCPENKVIPKDKYND